MSAGTVPIDTEKDYLSKFMAYYIAVVTYGQARIVPVAIRMALIFGTLQASWKMATEIGSGNQIKYVVTEVMKMSFIIFLITNWIQLGHAMGEWFESIGFLAGGIDPSMKDAPNIQPDSIWNNAMSFSGKMWENVEKASGIANTIMAFVVFLFIVVVLFLTAIEVFMCRIEFYTLTLLGTVLLPFFLVDKLNFLGTNTINGMFKISAKVMVIAFLQAVCFTILNSQLKEFYDGPAAKSSFAFGAYVELGMTCLVMYVLVKQIPNLVSNFLSGGGGGLGGGSMMGQLGAAVSGGARVATTGVQAVAKTMLGEEGLGRRGASGAKQLMSEMGGGAIAQGAAAVAGGLAGGMAGTALNLGKAAIATAADKLPGIRDMKDQTEKNLGRNGSMNNLRNAVFGVGSDERHSMGSLTANPDTLDNHINPRKQNTDGKDTPPPSGPPSAGGNGDTATTTANQAASKANEAMSMAQSADSKASNQPKGDIK